MSMLYLADFSVIKPDFGLIFWTVLIFLVLYFVLARLAFKPIQKALKKRDTEIQDSIDEAKRVQAQMAQLKDDNAKLLAEAREESTRIIAEAEAYAKKRKEEAVNEAKEAAQKVSADAQRDIANMRDSAMADLKKEVGTMALDIAEKVLQKDLKSDVNQTSLVNELVNNLN
ncbi:F0F1 ATP synthase subunit B [Neolewinella agarilytica]|uniref:ATP synthase subunit b n=1 Tax=Neolewinella agarilytica TaxID=478744 RepID=A0A1H9M781_9BACT|nr:F0F1 ATP synthase subunit B [Neolewinella agarilytica]SER19299.1 ATP synthase F0 subcomplex B subunit [Neolewinella agarilytica]